MKAIIFDYNGVLVDDLGIHFKTYCALAERHNSKATPDDIKKILLGTPSLRKIELIAGTREPAVTKKLLSEKTDIYLELVGKKDILFPETRGVLERLAKRFKLAIITNSTHQQVNKAFPSDLLEKFSLIITYEDVEKPKPAPDSLLMAMEKLGSNEACYVGDAVNDMIAAKAAGVLAIGISRDGGSRESLKKAGADIILESLETLEKSVESY